mmetsp:Transcript_15303/g.37640  ORF Transcript_15303/g.37640 Transcript_15303/m.37640 type:complete len:600 (-) Transcript_15303:219-2018(-)
MGSRTMHLSKLVWWVHWKRSQQKLSSLELKRQTFFSDVITGNFIATTEEPEKPTKEPVAVKSYGDETSCSSDSSDSETEFDIGGPSQKKAQGQEKKSDGVRSKQHSKKAAEVSDVKPDVTEPRSPSNGIYASVVKDMNRKQQLKKLRKERQKQDAAAPTKDEETEEFATGTDQLRDVYKQLFDTMNSPKNPIYLENSLQANKKSSVVIEELGAKQTGMDGETVFHSFDKDAVSGKESKPKKSEAIAVKEEPKPQTPPVAEKEKAVVSGILSALENTLAQMMLPDSLSQANVEESVIGSIGGENESADEQSALASILDVNEEETAAVPATPKLETEKVEVEPAKVSNQVVTDLLQKTQEQKALEIEKLVQETKEHKAMEIAKVLQKTQEQKATESDDVKATVSITDTYTIEEVKTMTDEDIEAELARMVDDDSVVSSGGGPAAPASYDGPTDNEILAELMGDIVENYDDDGQDNLKSMFDDATVDGDDQSALSLPSVYKPNKVRFSNGVSQLKIISEDTTDDLESLKRAAKALEEAINRASAAEVQRMNPTSGERKIPDKYAGEDEIPSSTSSGVETFTTAVMDETQEPNKKSWLQKMWK